MEEFREDSIKKDWQKYKSICLLATEGMKQSDNNESGLIRLEIVLFLCSEERHDVVMDEPSMHKIDFAKNKFKECKAKISLISGGFR